MTTRIRQRYEQIAEYLVRDMRRGRLRPGERLPGERELATRLGVGRASVREALSYLQLEGLVEIRPASGTYVARDALRRLMHEPGESRYDASPAAVLQARDILEPQTARLAASLAPHEDGPELERLLLEMEASSDPTDPVQRHRWSDADRHFHRQIAVLTGNPVLIGMAELLERIMDEPLWQRLRDESIAVPGRTILQLAEHRLIAAAVLEGDPELADRYARDHIHRARRYMALDDPQEPA